jgi:hypothetical protein
MRIERIVGFSSLAPFRPGHDYRPALDEIQALGGTLARAFCGPLPWCGQEIGHVYERLGGWLDACRERGQHGYLAYCTEAGTGYALDAHVRELEMITAGRDNVLKEVGNECDHPTQGGRLDPDRCRELAQRMAGTVGYGATITDDESPKYAGGAFVPVHLNRGRDTWNMVRRVREIEAMSASTGKPAFNQEPIGAAEASIPGRRESNPNVFFVMGVLDRLFEVGGVFHSDDGLLAQRLGPNQRLCAEAFVQGSRLWPGADRLRYLNVGHQGSPVVAADFNEGRNEEGCTRAYSGVVGNTGFTVALGVVGNPGLTWGNDWRPVEVLAERPGVVVWRVER